MTILQWDQVGERLYETGVDHGVLYIPDGGGAYSTGVAWNGLTNVNEAPSGAEANAQYADNIKYLNLISAEEFAATVEAFMYPDEFAQFDGLSQPTPGVYVGQQNRGVFGLSYRTRVGNDVVGDAYGEKVHLVYGCQASPSEKGYGTVNDSPEPINFSWEVNTTPVEVSGLRPTSILTIDSTTVDPTAYTSLTDFLWGTAGSDARLPLPDEVVAIFSGSLTEVTPTEPTFDNVDDITIPTITGITYYHNGTALTPGSYVITEDAVIEARPDAGYVFPAVVDTDWFYAFGG